MALRIDLPKPVMDQALAILRRPQSVEATAREMGIHHATLRNNLKRAGVYAEFKGRIFSSKAIDPINLKAWDESIANKYLQMALRRQA